MDVKKHGMHVVYAEPQDVEKAEHIAKQLNHAAGDSEKYDNYLKCKEGVLLFALN